MVAIPVRGRGGDDVDERKKKECVLTVSDSACDLFFSKQMHFLNLLILTIDFIFATCHISMK